MQCEQTFVLCETSFEKRQVFKCWKCSGVKVWQSHFKEITESMITSIIGNSFPNSDRKRCCIRKVAAVKTEKLKKKFLS